MLSMSQEIRNKPDWHEKVLKPEITAKWKAEAEAQGLTSEAADFIIEEVKYYATIRSGSIEPGPVDGTWIDEQLIDGATLDRFKKLVVDGLEKVPAEQKDYHPGSDELVLDLVHPSLFCYVEDRSILINQETIDDEFLPKTGETPVKKVCINYNEVMKPSGKYRWLPAEVSIKDDKVSFDTYINNLHPHEHKDLYVVLGEIFWKFIPLFNRTLTDVANLKPNRIDISRWSWYGDESFDYDKYGDDDYDEEYQEWEKNRPILPVPIPTFKAPPTPENPIDLKGSRLQVIVKLANIELTPESPKYDGGSWHVEGIEEERIVATGIYYYEMENITESKLAFRHSVDEPGYEQNDVRGVNEIYGLEDGKPLNQLLGKLTTKQGRCIVFPNIYQHQVAPFKLVDKTKPGFRKILVFFLVDPTKKIVSTHNVLPQQPNWNDVMPDAAEKDRKTTSRKEAEEFREKLMFERKYARDEFQKEYYEREFSLCEH